ncbi:MAG: hypothetical protein HS126_03020 [Anaerolineales bacterium]|nr:hypothetical protein [Anaerolineales bacterium]
MARTHVHDWLSLVSLSGLLVSEPVLATAFPHGPERVEPRLLRRFPREWERFRLNQGADPQERWLDFILHDLLGLGLDPAHRLTKGQTLPPQTIIELREISQHLRPARVLVDKQGVPLLLIGIVPLEQGLDRIETASGRWRASPFTKFDRLLRESGVPLGLLTNGLDWRLIYAAPGLTTATLTWAAQTWADERLTLDAFYTLLRAERFRTTKDTKGTKGKEGKEGGEVSLLNLIRESQNRQVDVADQLGEQVRAAVGLFVQALDAADRSSGGALLASLPLDQVYELSISLMMRLVFILYAEENGLLPHGEVLYDRGYGLTYLTGRLEQERRLDAESFGRAGDAWGQLLAAFRLIFAGCPHPDLSLRPYGGELFDPGRYGGLLEDARLQLSNATVYAILRKLTFARVRLGRDLLPQRVSYRSLDIEQIGYVYEGLLDHRLARAGAEPLLQLKTPKDGGEALVSLAELEALPPERRAAFLAGASRRDEAVIAGELAAVDEESQADLADEFGPELAARAAPYAGVILSGGVIPPDHLYVTTGQSRRAMGAHYTPQSLTAPIVETTLGPLVYERFEVVEEIEPQRTQREENKENLSDLRVLRGEEEIEPQRAQRTQREEDKENLSDLRVLRGLEKPAARWQGMGLKAPRDILNLKVCDMAMGSGAFLVQACRYLAERLVEAWDIRERDLNELNEPQRAQRTQREENKKEKENLSDLRVLRGEEEVEPQRAPREENKEEKENLSDLRVLGGSNIPARIQITPFGDASTARPQERLLPDNREERITLARRLVAERCLYGVDKNPLAVEMARLSLWLATLAKDRPFTFLNHALKCGDSLVGAGVDSLLRWPQDVRGTTMPLLQELLKQDLLRAAEARRRLQSFTVVEVEDAAAKARLHAEAEAALARLKLGGDLLTGARLAESDARRQKELLAELVERFIAAESEADLRPYPAAHRALDAAAKVRPFHWPFEFPEVFLPPEADPATPTALLDAGFDAFVGNPPFLGGTRISTTLGNDYLQVLQTEYPDFHSRADLCSLFFVRAFSKINRHGKLGLIATNTISQGDTREAGLEVIARRGGSVFSARSSMSWPGQAAVFVSVVHITKEETQNKRLLDNRIVDRITSRLDEILVTDNPKQLLQNQGKCFSGSKLDGNGFVIKPEEAESLLQKDQKNKDVLFPYLNGEDLNSRPDQFPTRWVVNFFDWELSKAENYPDCLEIARERVYPSRQKHSEKRTREHWWQFQRVRPELYQTIEPLQRVLAVAQTSRTLAFAFVQKGIVYSTMTIIFAFEENWALALLQSSVHELWVRRYASTLKQDVRYTPSDVFQNFPFPQNSTPEQRAALEQVGEQYHEHRRQVMLARQEGLTATYNRFHDPACQDSDIAELRRLHVEMDQAVLAAYGWSDVTLDHAFRGTGKEARFTLSEGVKEELLRRLLLLNFEIAAEEEKTTKNTKSAKEKGKAKKEKNEKNLSDLRVLRGEEKIEPQRAQSKRRKENKKEENLSDLRVLRGEEKN